MKPSGGLLASGRDSDIFECGPGRVLRRARDRRSMAFEARIMDYLWQHGYPVPRVYDLSEDGADLVMERIDGPTMVEALGRAPWKIRRLANMLADLHLRLHRIDPPDFLPPAEVGAGDRIVHMDLHPLNVMLGPSGPVVIDWPRAARGDPAVDVGLAWLLMAAGEIPGGKTKATLLGLGRSLLVRTFVSNFDRTEIAHALHQSVEWKAHDPNMSAAELATMRRLVAHETARVSKGSELTEETSGREPLAD